MATTLGNGMKKLANGAYSFLGFTFTWVPNAFSAGYTWHVHKAHGGYFGTFPSLGAALSAVKS